MSEETALEKVQYAPLAPIGNKRTLQSLIQQQAGALQQVLPRHLTADRLLKTVLLAVNRQPDLLECTQESVLEAVGRTAELGLDPSGTLGESYLVPFNNKIKMPDGREVWKKQCTLIPGYRGLAKLARQSGEIARLEANVVYEADTFDFEQGTDFKLRYKRSLSDDRGEVMGAYALAEFKDGSFQAEWMTQAEIETIRQRSPSKDSPAWRKDWGEMARKTVFRRLAKWLPLSGEKWQQALEIDNQDFDQVIDISPEVQSKADAAARKIAAAAGRKVPTEAEVREAEQEEEFEEAVAEQAAQEAAQEPEEVEDAPEPAPKDPELPERIPDALRRELLKVEGVGPKVLEGLEKVHATNVRSIYRLGVSGLKKAPNIGPKTAEALIDWASNVIDETHRAEALERGKAQKEEDKEPTFYRDSEYVQALLKKAEEHGVTKEQLGRQRDKIAEAAGLPAGTDPRALPDPAWKKLTEWVESAIHESLEFDDAEEETEEAAEPAGGPFISEGRQKMLQNTVQNLVSKLEGEDQDGWLADFAAWLREHAPEAEAGLSKSPRDFSRVPDAKYGELLAWITDSTAEWR